MCTRNLDSVQNMHTYNDARVYTHNPKLHTVHRTEMMNIQYENISVCPFRANGVSYCGEFIYIDIYSFVVDVQTQSMILGL